jgi:DNA invertase Pin-like site-specific DNA recombinase
MQANDGLSLDAQKRAIEEYCRSHDLRLVHIYQDVESGGKADRQGLQEALLARFDVLVVLKFDRLSRSIRHFCDMYEQHFADGTKELIAIREAIRLDSALGRALVSILLVFAQMEREATGERVRETIAHIHRSGYFFGKVPYGKKSVPAPDNPRYRILVPEPSEQAVLIEIKQMLDEDRGLTEIASLLNERKITPPQGKVWTKCLLYHLRERNGWHQRTPHNVRSHSDAESKARMNELRKKGHTYQQVANILNEEGYIPLKGKKFTLGSVCQLLGVIKESKVQTPREFCELLIRQADQKRPSYPKMARMLSERGFVTPKGNSHWWPAQVQQLLGGAFDAYYAAPNKARSGQPDSLVAEARV